MAKPKEEEEEETLGEFSFYRKRRRKSELSGFLSPILSFLSNGLKDGRGRVRFAILFKTFLSQNTKLLEDVQHM